MTKCTVTITREDCVELYHMIKSRGNSRLKTKLKRALGKLSSNWSQALLDYEKYEPKR